MKFSTFIILLVLIVSVVIYTREIPTGFKHLLAGTHALMQCAVYAQWRATKGK